MELGSLFNYQLQITNYKLPNYQSAYPLAAFAT
jgi:hypothetical protein